MRRFIIADTHFGHKNIIQYENRPFSSVEEMDNELIKLWNSVVNNDDLVYVLGDFTLSRRIDAIKNLVNQLHGRKILIMGNHDTRKPKDYVECGFEVATRKPMMVEPGVILMHEPFNDESLISLNYLYFFGHVHRKHTLMDDYPNCMCASAERIGFKPVDLDECIRGLSNNEVEQDLIFATSIATTGGPEPSKKAKDLVRVYKLGIIDYETAMFALERYHRKTSDNENKCKTILENIYHI